MKSNNTDTPGNEPKQNVERMKQQNPDYQQHKRIQQEAVLEADIRSSEITKIFCGGKFLLHDGNFWKRTRNQTSDFLTLQRQLIYVFLAFQGLIIREFVSSNGEMIIGVCYNHSQNIRKLAQQMSLKKPLDFGMTELMSLEPVDNKYRPFRINETLYSEKKWRESYRTGSRGGRQTQTQKRDGQLRRDIEELVKQIQFKKIVRKTKGYWDDLGTPKDYEIKVYDHQVISLGEWRQYKEFLTFFRSKQLIAEQEYQKNLQRINTRYQELNRDKNDEVVIKKFKTLNRSTRRIKKMELAKKLAKAYQVT